MYTYIYARLTRLFTCIYWSLVLTISFHFLFQHLIDVAACVVLARPLVKNFCQRLSTIFELEQNWPNFSLFHPASPSTLWRRTPQWRTTLCLILVPLCPSRWSLGSVESRLNCTAMQAPQWVWPLLKPGRSPACRHHPETASIRPGRHLHLMTGKSPSYNYVCVQRRTQE